jgi:hypothetical protein
MTLPNDLPEDLLMAYADGELDGAEHLPERARVEAAMKADPEVAQRVAKHRALRRRLSATFDPVLDEPVPDRLVAAVRAAPTATVSDLGRARASKAESAASTARRRASWSGSQWGAMAASLVIGAIIGRVALNSPELSPIAARDGRLVAQAGLAEALSNQLASAQPGDAPVQIGTSFKTKSGTYCRTFVLHDGEAMGGLACRAGDEWNVHTVARTQATPGADGGYRPAAAEMPAPVLAAVESEIAGDALDASGEAQARNSGWK